MPRCLMAKKWKAYPWQDRAENTVTTQETIETAVIESVDRVLQTVDVAIVTPVTEEEEEIDVVGDSPSLTNINASISATTNDSLPISAGSTTIITQHQQTNITNTTSNNSTASVIVGKTIIPTCWGPSSPTAGTTAPSPPPHSPEEATRESTILYNGEWNPRLYLLLYFFSSSVELTKQCPCV